MKKYLLVLILVAAGLLLFVLGGSAGIIYTQKGPQETKTVTVNSLSSGVISSIVAYGQITNISGRNITLNNSGSNLVIPIATDAQIYAFATPTGKTAATTAPVQQVVTFGDIKIWDKANVAVRLLPTGQLEGSSVIILPSAAQTK
jgi:hypothetical protein